MNINGPFRSFWMAGYEGADHRNGAGVQLNMLELTGHCELAVDDYCAARSLGLLCARESAGWRSIERNGAYDFSNVVHRAQAARTAGVQLLWTLCHYGWPEDLDVFSPRFVNRFQRFALALARVLKPYHDEPPIYSPLNEISFLCWAITETGLIHPYVGDLRHRGYELKQQLVRASIAACEAILSVDPRARFLHADPVIHVVGPLGDAELADEARVFREYQFQAWDMLCGRSEPQLGGDPRYLDFVGVNYYHGNQWEHGTKARLHWHLRDTRRLPLRALLTEVYKRYQRPLVIAETSHVGAGRAEWLDEVAVEAAEALAAGIPVVGACLYPAIDRPDWEDPQHWHESGLWDVIRDPPAPPRRQLNADYAAAVVRAQALITRQVSHANSKDAMQTIVVFSHLRWDFVYQRPQHLLSRLARTARILFVEEPVFGVGESRAELTHPVKNLTVLRPHTPVAAPGFHDDQIPTVRGLVMEFIDRERMTDYTVWLYTPMAVPLLQGLHPRIIVYDCMDELTAFAGAPRQLVQRENALLKAANLVFAGGPSLFAARRERHPHVHLYPSSVDYEHFAQAQNPAIAHATLQDIPRPRLGFFGVVDERFDTELWRAVAAARPDWQFCIVGPVVKIDAASLPVAPNLHYFGKQQYLDLPAFLAGWDVCLMPFARNEATRFISPTKTLEYMAAELPIVSTSITDVQYLYADVVRFADTPAAFLAACEDALAESPQQRLERRQRMRVLTAKTSWDRTADSVRVLIDEALASGLTDGARQLLAEQVSHPARIVSSPPTVHAACVIVGAGPTGLSAAYHYGAGSVLLEKEATVGGWCRSVEDAGFTFDFAGHIMFSNDPYVKELYQLLLGENVHWQNREAWIYSKNVHTRYPFQGSLFGLPPDVVKECIVGAVAARMTAGAQPASSQRAGAAKPDCCADGTDVVSGQTIGIAQPPRNFEEFIYRTWGAGIAKHFAIPYNRKLWAVPLTEMETSWISGRVPLPDLEEMIEGALVPSPKPMGPNARFGYPLSGGFQALMNGFLPLLKGDLALQAKVEHVSPRSRTVRLTDGRRYRYETLISTIPLPKLIAGMGDEAPAEIQHAARELRHVSVRCVNLGIGRARLTDKHWIYYPEDTIFHRIFLQGNASPHCNPPGGFGFTCEITYSAAKPLPAEGQALIERCVADCIRVGLISESDPIVTANQVDMPCAYVVYDHGRGERVEKIRTWLSKLDILLAGRYSEWEYFNSDHAFMAGKKAAEMAKAFVSTVRLPKIA